MFTTNVDGSGVLDVPVGDPTEIDGVSVRYFPIGQLKRLYVSPTMGQALAKEVHRFDVVHVNGVFLWPGAKASMEAARAGVPLVLSPRGMLVGDLIAARSSVAKRVWIAAFERRNIARASAVHLTSEVEAEEIHKLRLPIRRSVTIPNGVEPPDAPASPQAEEAQWRGAPKGRRIAFAARLDWKKGVDLAIEVAAGIPDAQLRLAGPDEGGLRRAWEHRLQDRGLDDRIRFVGELNDAEKWAFLSGADVTLVPSINENFGNVVIESMAVGTPVVCTEGVGAGYLAKQIDRSLVVPRNIKAIGSSVLNQLTNEIRRRELGRLSRLLVERDLTWNSVAQSFVSLYSSVGLPSER